jgi:hypothetical protein
VAGVMLIERVFNFLSSVCTWRESWSFFAVAERASVSDWNAFISEIMAGVRTTAIAPMIAHTTQTTAAGVHVVGPLGWDWVTSKATISASMSAEEDDQEGRDEDGPLHRRG